MIYQLKPIHTHLYKTTTIAETMRKKIKKTLCIIYITIATIKMRTSNFFHLSDQTRSFTLSLYFFNQRKEKKTCQVLIVVVCAKYVVVVSMTLNPHTSF